MTGVEPEYLAAKLNEVKRLHDGNVLVDLRKMPATGSTGLGFLVGIFTSVTVNGGKFVLVGLQPRVQEVFRLTRLNTIIPSASDMASGLAALGVESSQARAE